MRNLFVVNIVDSNPLRSSSIHVVAALNNHIQISSFGGRIEEDSIDLHQKVLDLLNRPDNHLNILRQNFGNFSDGSDLNHILF